MTQKQFSFTDNHLDKATTKTLLLEILSHTISFYELNQFGAVIRNDQHNPIKEEKLVQLKQTLTDLQAYLDNESERAFNVSIQINID